MWFHQDYWILHPPSLSRITVADWSWLSAMNDSHQMLPVEVCYHFNLIMAQGCEIQLCAIELNFKAPLCRFLFKLWESRGNISEQNAETWKDFAVCIFSFITSMLFSILDSLSAKTLFTLYHVPRYFLNSRSQTDSHSLQYSFVYKRNYYWL